MKALSSWTGRMALAGWAAASACTFAPVAATASDYTFQAEYRVTLGGVPIGKANLVGSFDGPKYRLDGYGKLTGLVGAVYEYTASASSAGRLQPGRAQPQAFSANATEGSKTSTVRMTMNNSGVRQLKLTPAPTPYWTNHPNRVKVTDAHTRNTLDPMSALIVETGSAADGLDRRACERTVPVFNGRERFDVDLAFRRIETVSNADVPGGQVLVCGARYRAVAGHRTDRDEVTYAEKLDIEVMLAPVSGSALLVPYRVTIPTPLGPAVVQAGSLKANGSLAERAASLAQ